MNITEQDLQNWINSALEHGACQDHFSMIISCKTVKEVIIYPYALKWAIWYANRVLKGKWNVINFLVKERKLLGVTDKEDVCRLLYYMECHHIGPWKEVEDLLLMEEGFYYPFMYVKKCLKGRWFQFEKRIENSRTLSEDNVRIVLYYALGFKPGPWDCLEKFIIKTGNPWLALHYCEKVINKPCQRLEGLMSIDPHIIYLYSKNVLKRPWKEGEKVSKF